MTRARILIIDPSQETRTMYAGYFRHHGYDVVEAADAGDGAALVAECQADLVVTELSADTEWMDALWTLRMSRHSGVPMIACSTTIEARCPWGPACVDVALPKPTSPRDLLEQAQCLLERGAAAAVAAGGAA
jgi:DNA-binding response OmpR family regulator